MNLLFLSKRIFLGIEDGLIDGGIIVDNEGIIRKILRSPQEVNTYIYNTESEAVFDFENLVLMPGLVDANVHINEPGRKDWEGFVAATKAAAAGGFTTIIDGPSNTIPPTTSVANLKTKLITAGRKIFIDVGFWGGFVPENIGDLQILLSAGVIGLQCSLCPSAEPVGNSFPAVTKSQLENALTTLDDGSLIAFHAEIVPAVSIQTELCETKKYDSFLRMRPAEMEVNAVQLIANLASSNKKKRFHVLNISSEEVLPIIKKCKSQGALLTADTCPHYLTLIADEIEDCHTEYKTQPPIRGRYNQSKLWEALRNGDIDMITTDHSPTTPRVKCLSYGKNRGNFLVAWPGISSLQLALSIVWTRGQAMGLCISDVYRIMCETPVSLCGLQNFKGKIAEGYDADFCIWDPDEEFSVTTDMILSTNKSTPYINKRLRGVVHNTVVRGLHVFQRYEGFGQPLGRLILKKN